MKKVLIVEDNPSQQFYLRHFLVKYFECETMSAENGMDALEIIHQEHPDLILLDIAMPVMDGLQMLEHLRNQDKDRKIPVIIMTALDERKVLFRLMTLGISDYILKPISAVSIFNKIERHLQAKSIVTG